MRDSCGADLVASIHSYRMASFKRRWYVLLRSHWNKTTMNGGVFKERLWFYWINFVIFSRVFQLRRYLVAW